MLIRGFLIFVLVAPPLYGAHLVSAYWYWPLGSAVGVFALLGLYRRESRKNRLLLCGLTSTLSLLNCMMLSSIYMQGTGFNARYFYHFSVSSYSVASEQFSGAFFGGIALWLLSSVLPMGLKPLQLTGQRRFYGAALLSVATCAPLLSFGHYFIDRYRPDSQPPLPDLTASQPVTVDDTFTPRKNLLLIYAESVEQLYFDETIFGDITPRLRRLQSEGLAFTNVHEVKNTGSTIAGIIASQCGLPGFNNTAYAGSDAIYPNAHCLMDVLSAYDYETVYLGGARMGFAGKGRFLEYHGYRRILGREAVLARQADPEYRTGWGAYDDSLLQVADRELERLVAQEKPFALTVLTLDTHHPAGHPSQSCRPLANVDNAILHAVACSDQLLGEFIARIRRDPRHRDTVIFVMSDHLAMRNSASDTLQGHQDERRLLAFALGEDIRAEQHEHPATHFDLGPTILELLDIPGYRQNNWGHSLLDNTPGYWFQHRASLKAPAQPHFPARDPVWQGVAQLDPEGPTIVVDGRRFIANVNGFRFDDGMLYALVFDRRGDFIRAVGTREFGRLLTETKGSRIIAVSRNEAFNARVVGERGASDHTWFVGDLDHIERALKGTLRRETAVDLELLPTNR